MIFIFFGRRSMPHACTMENFLDYCCHPCATFGWSPFYATLHLILSGDVESNPGPLDTGTSYRILI